MPDHTRGAHPTASGRLQTVVLIRQSYPALTNGGVVNADVPCGTGALVTQTTLRTLRKLSHHLGSRLPLRGLLPESSRTGARWATVLRRRGLLPESSRTRGARWATVLRHRGPQIADSYAPSAGKSIFSLLHRVLLASAGPRSCRPWSSTNFHNKSSCACTWTVKVHDISKDRWPVSQPKF